MTDQSPFILFAGKTSIARDRAHTRGLLSSMDPRIKIALQIMNEMTQKDLTVAHVAQEIGLSSSPFEHILKQATGRPFWHHLRTIRIKQAKRVLKDWHLSLKQVGNQTGYSSPSSFSRAFKSTVRRSPSEYRLTGLVNHGSRPPQSRAVGFRKRGPASAPEARLSVTAATKLRMRPLTFFSGE